MREIFAEVETWRKAGKPVAIATNVKKEGPSLRPLGAKMAVTATRPHSETGTIQPRTETGTTPPRTGTGTTPPRTGTGTTQEIAGSVTGGCIEGAVYEEAQAVIKNGQPKLLHYGVPSDEAPWEVGLSCGGTLDVLVESLDSPDWQIIYPALKICLDENRLAAVATVISGSHCGKKLMLWPNGRALGSLGSAELDVQAQAWMQKQMATQETNWTAFDLAGEQVQIFVDVFAPVARMVVVGAVHIAIALVALAKTLGYHTIVVDPRTAFATRERFPHVDELIAEWPSTALEKLHLDEGTYIAVLSHDEKLDNPALKVALTSPARYVGVLGTRKKIPQRFAALRELGVTNEELTRLHAPIGMNLAAVMPDEIALSILAEMVAARHGKGQPQFNSPEKSNEAVPG